MLIKCISCFRNVLPNFLQSIQHTARRETAAAIVASSLLVPLPPAKSRSAVSTQYAVVLFWAASSLLVQVHSTATVSHSVACKSKTHTYVQAQKATETGKPQLTGSKADMAYDGSDVSALEQTLEMMLGCCSCSTEP